MDSTKLANPGPLGLLGFGMTTVLLNLHNTGVIELTAVIVGMGFALGGAAQIIAGIMEFRKNNLFGATAFTSYGLFWWSLVFIWSNPFGHSPADSRSMGCYLLLWGIFTLFMAIGSLKHNHATKVVFFSLALLFILLSIGDLIGNADILMFAGFVGIFCGSAAMYSGLAQVVNNEFGKTVLPLGGK